MANLRVDKITSTETFEKTGSVQFDGSGDKLSIPNNVDFRFGSGDFTLEAWIMVIGPAGDWDTVVGMWDSSETRRTFSLQRKSDGELYLYVSTDGGSSNWAFAHGGSIETSTWYHVAGVRDGNTLRVFIDGVQVGTATYSDSILNNTTDALFIGDVESSDSNAFRGHISNVRVIKGRALYTSNFKPPMRELEVVPGTVLLACQSKTDASLEKTGKTITVSGNAVANELTPGILTPIVKSGGGSAITGSVEFTSTTDALVLSAGTDFAYGTGDFTIEAWIQPQGINGGETKAIFTQSQSGNDYIIFKVDSDKAIKATFGATTVSGGTVEVGSWHHVAVTRASNTVKIFVNGVASAGTTVSTDFSDTTRNPTIGQYTHSYGSIEYYGFISNLRINKGTALYTDSFIPPTRELKKVPGTVLLCCQDSDSPLTEATGKTITGYGDLRRTDGSELVTNGDFSNGTTGWTISDAGEGSMAVVSGQLVVTNDDTNDPPVYAWQQITTVAGNRYRVGFQLVGGTASSTAIYLNSASSFGDAYGQRATSGTNPLTVGALGELEFVAAGTSAYILLRVNANEAATSIFDNISAYAIPHDADAPASNFTPQVGDDRKVTFEGVTKIDTDAYFYLPTGDTESREATGTYNAGTRGVALGGDGSNDITIDYITIASTGDAIDFGDLTISDSLNGDAVADHTRGVCLGGRSNSPTPNSRTNAIQFVTISSTGNSQDFGDLVGMNYGMAGFSDSTRGISAGGGLAPNSTANIDYITISSKGDGQDFGDCINTITYSAGFSSPTRGIKAGGAATPGAGAELDNIEYVTIQTKGNGQDFGDLIRPAWRLGGCSNAVRGVILEGETPAGDGLKAMSFVTIASMGNAQEFGDSTTAGQHSNGTSSSTRGVFMGRQGASPYANLTFIDFVHIMTTANAQDFGDLTIGRQGVNACSNGHGGLG